MVCVAQVLGKADFKLENLYKISLDVDLYLGSGSKLVVKFYKYDNTTLQDNSVIDNFAPPENIKENENVPHPQGKPVEIATLVLTTDNTEEVISTIVKFTVTKSIIFKNYMRVKREYPKPGADKPALFKEYCDKKKQYIKAPTKPDP